MIAGTLALHGGGEFLPGDEGFLRACLEAARPPVVQRAAGTPTGLGRSSRDDPGAIRIVIVPAAAAGQRPDLAARHGVEAFARVAAASGIPAHPDAAMVVDAASAASGDLAGRLADADLIHLPGGDPGRLLEILEGSSAWRAILTALDRGAVLAGASAGAMVLADSTWTPGGWRRGLGLVPGIVVVPHAERVARGGWAGHVRRPCPRRGRADRSPGARRAHGCHPDVGGAAGRLAGRRTGQRPLVAGRDDAASEHGGARGAGLLR